MRQVHTPRLSFLMRSSKQPVIRSPIVRAIHPAAPMSVVPWFAMGEYGASMAPRSNPAFNDAWVIGATGGASRVIPQGIDYSRTPCCTTGLSGMDVTPLVAALIGVPLVLFGMQWLLGSFVRR